MRVWWVQEFADERRVLVDTVPGIEPCLGCGQRAESKGRATVEVRDLPSAGKPTRLVWVKRVWRCRDCRRSWRETHPDIAPRAVLTGRARREAARQVGEDGDAVAAVARSFGVSWDTVMRAVTDEATRRFAAQHLYAVQAELCLAFGVDEKVMNRATRGRRRRYVGPHTTGARATDPTHVQPSGTDPSGRPMSLSGSTVTATKTANRLPRLHAPTGCPWP